MQADMLIVVGLVEILLVLGIQMFQMDLIVIQPMETSIILRLTILLEWDVLKTMQVDSWMVMQIKQLITEGLLLKQQLMGLQDMQII